MNRILQNHVRGFGEGAVEESEVLLVDGVQKSAGTELDAFIGEQYRCEENHVESNENVRGVIDTSGQSNAFSSYSS